jgi:hypothetical protein
MVFEVVNNILSNIPSFEISMLDMFLELSFVARNPRLTQIHLNTLMYTLKLRAWCKPAQMAVVGGVEFWDLSITAN